MTGAKRAALGFVFIWFFVGGIGHFVATDFFASIVPPWWPWSPALAVWISGVFELLGALGLLSAATRPYAGAGLCLLIVAVTPANLYMLEHAERFPAIPVWALWARLPLQIFLLWCAWWSTRPGRPHAD